jgi:hypothetical protein
MKRVGYFFISFFFFKYSVLHSFYSLIITFFFLVKNIKFILKNNFLKQYLYKRSPAYREFERKRKRDIYYKEDNIIDRELNKRAVDNSLTLMSIMLLVGNCIEKDVHLKKKLSTKYDYNLFYTTYTYTTSQITTNLLLVLPTYYSVFNTCRLSHTFLLKYINYIK